MWLDSLRQATAEDYLDYCVAAINPPKKRLSPKKAKEKDETIIDVPTAREIDSTVGVKRMLENLENNEMQ